MNLLGRLRELERLQNTAISDLEKSPRYVYVGLDRKLDFTSAFPHEVRTIPGIVDRVDTAVKNAIAEAAGQAIREERERVRLEAREALSELEVPA
jgi:hypothetical protein